MDLGERQERPFLVWDSDERREVPAVWPPFSVRKPCIVPNTPGIEQRFHFVQGQGAQPHIDSVEPGIPRELLEHIDPSLQMLMVLLGECRLLCRKLTQRIRNPHKQGVEEVQQYVNYGMLEVCHASKAIGDMCKEARARNFNMGFFVSQPTEPAGGQRTIKMHPDTFLIWDSEKREMAPATWKPLRMPWPSLRPGDAATESRFQFSGDPTARPYIHSTDGPYRESNAKGLDSMDPGFISKIQPQLQILASMLGECNMLRRTLLEQVPIGHSPGLSELKEFTLRAILELLHASEAARAVGEVIRSLKLQNDYVAGRIETLRELGYTVKEPKGSTTAHTP